MGRYAQSNFWYHLHPRPSREGDIAKGLGISLEKFNSLKEQMRHAASKAKPPGVSFRGRNEDTFFKAVSVFCIWVPEIGACRNRCPPFWFKEAMRLILQRFCARQLQLGQQIGPTPGSAMTPINIDLDDKVQVVEEDSQRQHNPMMKNDTDIRKHEKTCRRHNGPRGNNDRPSHWHQGQRGAPTAPRAMREKAEREELVIMVTLPNTHLGEVITGSEIIADNGRKLSLRRFKGCLSSRLNRSYLDAVVLLIDPDDGQMLPLRCESVFQALLGRCIQAGHQTVKVVVAYKGEMDM